MLRYITSYKLLLAMFLFSIILEVAYTAAAPLSLKFLVDDAFIPKNFHVFSVVLIILLGGGIFNIFISTCGDYSLGKLGGEVVRQLRTELFAHLQKQSLPFYQRYKVGDLVTRFISDMLAMEKVVRGSFPYFLKEALSVMLGLVMLFAIEWKLTLAMLAGSSLMFIGPRLLQSRATEANISYKEAQEKFSNTIDEMVKGHKTIRGLHLQARFRERARQHIHQLFSTGLKLHIANSLMERLPLTALLILNGIMIGFGGYLIFQDAMTVGGFIAFFTLFLSVGQSITNLSYLIPALIDSSVSFRRINEILAHKSGVPEAEDAQQLPARFGSISMEHVTFGYSEEAAADQLRDVSLSVTAGSYVAFVGPSGSGKSTALQLLSRFYDPKQGTVLIDGYDLRGVSEASLRKLITLVTQDTFLFNTTIRDNLLLESGGTKTADKEMFAAARQANIHPIIESWPAAYDTLVHHEGGSLSGGERQRLSIARALLRNPQLLLLDEVTSALDPATEADINELIQRIRQDKTIISVTHRLASIVNADMIYVFHEGRIAESGSHQELLQLGGLYSSLWEKQIGFQLSQDGLHATVDAGRLAKLPFFGGIEPSLLQDIAVLFSTETCKDGEEIVREGEEGSKFYIIVRGKVEVLKQIAGVETKVAVLQDGDHFGEIALLRNVPRNATVRASGHAVLLSVRREAFLQLTGKYPQIAEALEETLRKRI